MVKLLYIILIPLLTALDQLIKYLVVTYLKPIGSVTIIPGLLEFRYLENRGAAFGIFQNLTWFFAIATVIITTLITIYLIKNKPVHPLVRTSAIMIIAGGFGNLIDRIFLGFVVDFIHALFFDYIFNFADCLVVVGVCLFIIYTLFIMKNEKPENNKEENGEKNESDN